MYVELKPKKFETFLAVKGFARYVECHLTLLNAEPKNKKHKKDATKVSQLQFVQSISVTTHLLLLST